MEYGCISSEAEELLKEIIQHEGDGNYWKERFEGLSDKDDVIIRGCFKELRENGLVEAQYADNYPYLITILKDGYLYEEHIYKSLRAADGGARIVTYDQE